MKGREDLIFVPENQYQVCASCHNKLQPTKELRVACLAIGSLSIGIKRIEDWYVGLWSQHGIPIPIGNVEYEGLEYLCNALNIKVKEVESKIWNLTKS